MNRKIVYASLSLSSVHLLQGMALLFSLAGSALALELLGAPVTSVTSHVTHQGWAIGLGIIAVTAPIAAWLYGRRVVASLALSADGRAIFIKNASLLGPSADQWPTDGLKISPLEAGDANGEGNFGLPRITLTVRDKTQYRRYILNLRSQAQLNALRAAFH